MDTNTQKRFRLLVVENNPSGSQSICKLLSKTSKLSFQIKQVSTLKVCLAHLKTGAPYDAILIDLDLPDAKGTEAFIKVKEQVPHVAAIVVTNTVDQLVALSAIREGAEDYFVRGESDERALPEIIEHAIVRREFEGRGNGGEDVFKNLAESAPVMIWTSDTKGSRTFFNQTWLDFTGRQISQELDKGWCEGIHPTDKDRTMQAYSNAANAKIKFRLQYRLRSMSGDYRWLLDSGVPRFSIDGAFIGFLGTCIDITELKEAEKACGYQVEFEKLIASLATHFINLRATEIDQGLNFALETIGKFAGVDRSYIFILNYEEKTFSNTHEWCASGISSEKDAMQNLPMERFQWVIDQYMKLQTVYVPNVAKMPEEARSEQEEFTRQAIKSLVNVPMIHSGKVLGFIGFDSVREEKVWEQSIISLLKIVGEMFINALERKRADEALHYEEKKLRMLIENTPAAIAMLDRDMRYIQVSRRWMEDYKLGEESLVGKSHFEVFPEIPDRWKETLKRCLAGAVEQREEDWFERTDGTVHCVRWQIHPWYEGNGQIGGVVMFTEVITDRKNSELALIESEKRFKSYFNLSLIGIAIMSPMKGWLEVNDKLCQILGYPRAELKDLTWMELTHPEDLVEDLRQFDQILSGKSDEYSVEKRFIKKDGSIVYTRTNLQCIRRSNGTVDYFIAVVEDVSAEVFAEKEWANSEEKYYSLYNSSRDGIVLLDMNGIIQDANPAFLQMVGFSKSEIKGVPHVRFSPPKWNDLEKEVIQNQVLKNGYSEIYEKEYIKKDGTIFPVTLRTWVTKDKLGQPNGMWCTVRDLSERKKIEERIRHLAYYDRLTDLPNRTIFMDRLNQAMISARYSTTNVALLFLGLDHFKRINDTLGHAVGDRLLRSISQRLIQYLQEVDTMTRIGGDEFVIMLPQVQSSDHVVKMAERIFDALSAPFMINGHEIFMSCSVGVSIFPADGTDPETLMKNADTAMERSKREGGNTYRLYSSAMNARAMERLALENELRHALEREEFCLFYQPQVNLRTGFISGMEALIRWQHPTLGLLRPADFLPLAEQSGLIVAIDDWVLRHACQQNKKWEEAGYLLPIAVNLTARQFQQAGFIQKVHETLKSAKLSAEQLELELTEQIIMHDIDETIPMLQELSNMGVRISIDDFGIGYSSLNYLKRFPINTLKIDRSFVQDITTDPDDAAIVKAIISLAHNLKLDVVAESVETESQYQFLKNWQCDKMQGYLYSRPVPADTFIELLKGDDRYAI